MTEAYWNCDVTRKAIVGLYSSSKPTMAKAHINEGIFLRAEYMLWANFARNNRDALKKKSDRVTKDGLDSALIEAKELSGFDFGITL